MLVVTTGELPGYRVESILGVVVGVTARPLNRFTEGVRVLDNMLTETGEHQLAAGRREAVERMVFHTRGRGGNAVLGMRFDSRVVSSEWIEICAYGTAVMVVPITAPRPRRETWRPRGRRAATVPPPTVAVDEPAPALYEATMLTEPPPL
jgi:uncharacterized protein YbjQ (UPF0145 family)